LRILGAVVPKKTILVVDDDAATRVLVHAVLRAHDFVVEDAHSGHDAITRISEKRYDAVILDIMMGDGSGHEVLEVLARQRPDVRCVVVVSATSAANLEKVAMANVAAKLRKPFDIDALVQAVLRCVDQ